MRQMFPSRRGKLGPSELTAMRVAIHAENARLLGHDRGPALSLEAGGANGNIPILQLGERKRQRPFLAQSPASWVGDAYRCITCCARLFVRKRDTASHDRDSGALALSEVRERAGLFVLRWLASRLLRVLYDEVS